MNPEPPPIPYTFGDSDDASERLRLLARLFEAPTRELLDLIPGSPTGPVLDLGCGPGHTSGLLAERFPEAEVVGIDQSPSFIDEANRAHIGYCRFVPADVTVVPLPYAPARLIYARFVLSHLEMPSVILARWATQVMPQGQLVLEEPEAIASDDALLRRYLKITSALIASVGGDLYAGSLLRSLAPAATETVVDRLAEVDLPARLVARMFRLNLSSWASHPFIVEHYDAAEIAALARQLDERSARPSSRATARWSLRQVVLEVR